jgi:hypothetical protein
LSSKSILLDGRVFLSISAIILECAVLVVISDVAESCFVLLRLAGLDCFRGERMFFSAFPESVVGIVEVWFEVLRFHSPSHS